MSYIMCLAGGMLFFRALGFSVDDSFRWSIILVFAARDMKELVFSPTLRAVDPPSALVGGGNSENSAGN